MNAENILNASVAFSLAAELVRDEPSEERIRLFWRENLFEEVPFAEDNDVAKRGSGFLASWFSEITEENLPERVSTVRSEWIKLLVGPGTPDAPTMESYYYLGNAVLQGERTVAMRRLYKKHGLELARRDEGPDDQLGLMLEFLGLLLLREHEAVLRGEGGAADILRADQRAVLEEHLLYWFPQWYMAMKDCAKTGYYQGIADLVFAFVQELAKRFGLEIK